MTGSSATEQAAPVLAAPDQDPSAPAGAVTDPAPAADDGPGAVELRLAGEGTDPGPRTPRPGNPIPAPSSGPLASGAGAAGAGAVSDPARRIVRPADALAELITGNRRFVTGQPQHGHDVSAAAAASGGQLPHAVVLGCIDSRVPLEAIFDQTFGSICVIRSGGHVVDRAVLGSVGFAVSALNVPLIMVLGHVRCGAVDATVQALRDGTRPDGDVGYLVDEIAPAVESVGLDDPEATAKAMRAHVTRTVNRLREVTGVPAAVAEGKVAIAGAVYDLDTGWVDLLT